MTNMYVHKLLSYFQISEIFDNDDEMIVMVLTVSCRDLGSGEVVSSC